MAIGFLSPNAKFTFRRNVLQGYRFVGHNLVPIASTSTHIRLSVGSSIVEFDFIYHNGFWAGNSNSYTIDYVFDFDSSQAYVSGVPAASGVFCNFGWPAGEFNPRAIIDFGGTHDSVVTIDLPLYDSPWYIHS